jgi:hypothetical protein
MANTYLTRTFVTPTSNQKFTASFWFKRAALSNGILLQTGSDYFYFNSDAIDFEMSIGRLKTNRLLRDTSGWYNVIVAVDTTLGTADDRIKMYINGVQETSFSARSNPSQNATSAGFNTAVAHKIGQRQASPGNDLNFDGSMAFVAFIDGKQEAPTVFGETDTTTGEWKIKTSITPTSAWGNNGFFILKDGNSVTDQSGEGHNFTVGGGTLTKTEDCPDNVFCTMNPLDNYYTVHTFSNGNTTVTAPSSGYSGVIGTMGASSGKYYFEFKPISKTGDNDEYSVGIAAQSVHSVNQPHWKMSLGYMYTGVNGNKINNDSSSSYGNTFTAGDIIGVAMDLDNLKLYFSKNGTWQTSGDPTSGSTGTGAAFTLTSPTSEASLLAFSTGYYLPCCAFASNSAGAVMSFNFGNGFFGTTAISSEGTNASGIGKFEYDVPAGYTALSTKGLNS